MAKLTRVTNKIFGENATATGDNPNIGQFGSALAGTYVGTTDVATIQNLPAWGQGWIGAVTPTQQFPALPEMTGAMKVLSYQTAYNQQMGIPEYDSATTYYTNSFCQVNGVIYKSKADDNQGNNPTEESSDYWEVLNLGGGYHPPILSCMWSDHLINDIQWLRADTFSWQSGDVYTTAYNKLVEEYATGSEETEDDITFKRTSNGFKIATADYETAILNKYNTYGIAWFYILDTTNKRFKLPRTKFGFEGLRTNVGDDIAQEVLLPNVTGDVPIYVGVGPGSGSFYTTKDGSGHIGISGTGTNDHLYFDASRLSSVYSGDGTNTKIQPPATQMYLYFYVGEYAQSAIEQTAGLNSELFNGKLDVSTYNANPRNEAVYLKTTYVNGTSGYNIWSNGYCEQWGKYYVNTSGSSTTFTISFLKTFNDTNYNFILSAPDMASGFYGSSVQSINVDSISWKLFFNASIYIGSVQWKASGYLAEGQY